MRFLFALMSLPVLAHTLYYLPAAFRVTPGDRLVFSLHNGDSFPASDEAVAPERIADARLVSPSGETPITRFFRLGKATHGEVTIQEPGSHWLVVRTHPNQLSMDAVKFEKYLREEGLESIIRWRAGHGESTKAAREAYSKAAKSLIVSGQPSADWSRVIGLPLEFVPLADPSRLHPGDSLPVKLLWQGREAPGIRVERAWAGNGNGIEIVGYTSPDGTIEVPLHQAARWRIHAVTMQRASQPDADWVSNWASLTFETLPRIQSSRGY